MEDKERKIDSKHRAFEESWTLNFCSEQLGKCICLICLETIRSKKGSEYQTSFWILLWQLQKPPWNSMRRIIKAEKAIFFLYCNEIFKPDSGKNEAIKQVFKECIIKVVAVVCPENKDIFFSETSHMKNWRNGVRCQEKLGKCVTKSWIFFYCYQPANLQFCEEWYSDL